MNGYGDGDDYGDGSGNGYGYGDPNKDAELVPYANAMVELPEAPISDSITIWVT